MIDEARTMEHARAQGYPVPAVEQVSDDGSEIVMERVEGPLMFEVISRRPWKVTQQGRILGDLHQQLHAISAPAWVPHAPFGEGAALLHLDLHPLNVIISPNGPVVIDWSNARRGDGDADLALTWVLLVAGGIPSGRVKAAVLSRGRALLVNAMLSRFDRSAVAARLPEVVEWKLTDANMSPPERRAMRALVDRQA